MPAKDDAAKRRAALRGFMAEHDLKPAEWARKAGLTNANAIYNFLAGRADALSIKTYVALSRAVPFSTVSMLMGEGSQKNMIDVPREHGIMCSLVVRGSLVFDEWTDSLMFEPSKQFKVSMPIESEEARSAFALMVNDEHAEKFYPPGTIVAVVPFVRSRARIQSGRRVIVARHRRDGMVNQSVREVTVAPDGKAAWLSAPSSQPKYQSAVSISWPPTGPVDVGDETIEITGLVIGSYTPEG